MYQDPIGNLVSLHRDVQYLIK